MGGFFSGINASEQLLQDLDHVRQLVIPAWNGISSANMELHLIIVEEHLVALLNRSESNFDLKSVSARLWTYKEWAQLLDRLASNNYWLSISPSDISIQQLTVSHQRKDPVEKCKIEPTNAKVGNSVNFSPPCSPSDRLSDGHKRKVRRSYKKNDGVRPREQPAYSSRLSGRSSRIEEVYLSDSTSANDSESNATSDDARRHYRKSNGHSRSYSRPKEVVKPMNFEMNGNQSLKQFFVSFERYFEAKFDGDSRDRTQELRDFLPAEMRNFYEVLGGRRLKYHDMKEELTRWHKSQRVGGTQYWREQLKEAKMNPSDTLRLFGTRLREMGHKAYPHSSRECLKEMRRVFLREVPRNFARRILENEDTVGVIEGRDKLTWAEMMQLAEREDRRQKVHKKEREDLGEGENRVWFSRGVTASIREDEPKQLPFVKSSPPKMQRTPFVKSSPPVKQQAPFVKGSPPRMQRAGFSGHPPRSFSRQPSNFLPKKSPGAECCNWCGLPGHQETNCWRRMGACIICGDPSHDRLECPMFIQRTPSSFSPVCPLCRGNHLGKNCSQGTSENR
jgi:hypothetical protein